MVKVVGVRFRPAGKIYYFDPGELELPLRSGAIVETARGVEYGEVAVAVREVPETDVVQPLKRVLRAATPADRQRLTDLRARDREAMVIGKRKIAEHGLDMQLVDVESTFDGSKMIFQFTAEGRVDFRELVRDLASVFRTRIELRQIGVRDEAKLLGGIGICGLTLCCSTWLTEFYPVSIRMAKDQNLSLNPAKISGVCGRLLCCLRYELNLSPEPGAAAKVAERVAQEDEPVEEPEEGVGVTSTAPRPEPPAGDRRWAKAVAMPEPRNRPRGSVAPAPAAPTKAPRVRVRPEAAAPTPAAVEPAISGPAPAVAAPGSATPSPAETPAQNSAGSRRRRRRRSRHRRSPGPRPDLGGPAGGPAGEGSAPGAPGPSRPSPAGGEGE